MCVSQPGVAAKAELGGFWSFFLLFVRQWCFLMPASRKTPRCWMLYKHKQCESPESFDISARKWEKERRNKGYYGQAQTPIQPLCPSILLSLSLNTIFLYFQVSVQCFNYTTIHNKSGFFSISNSSPTFCRFKLSLGAWVLLPSKGLLLIQLLRLSTALNNPNFQAIIPDLLYWLKLGI